MNDTTTIEIADNLANQIIILHTQAEVSQEVAMGRIEDLIDSRLNVAALVEAAKARHGQHFKQWWDDNELPSNWAARYLTIAKTSKRVHLGDKNQMRLIGILPEGAEEPQQPQQRREENALEWIKLAGRLTTTLTSDRIKSMDNFQRRLAIDKLKPFIEIYRELGGE